ncbi:uncharacterized protein LOC100904226 [Galendromus occidentalis]|uniref:Uncharacterized protein LOC100904226 n=1 Tax=Galendromus occidentalis TaxID=34638 RepID=A0AAJ6QSP4_9ACAR|nr:uncharacterized protein LOC100904226 [Galendromus occidentalis]
MRGKEVFDFDAIACPNTFEDDPKVDVFFDRVKQCAKREVLRKTALTKNLTATVQRVSMTEAARKNIQKRARSFRERFLPQRKDKPVVAQKENDGAQLHEQVTPVNQVLNKPPLVPPRTRRVGARSIDMRDENTPKQDVKLAKTTPLRSKRVFAKETEELKNSHPTVTPKRKRSLTKATRIRFEPRDSLRRMSLRKSITKAQKTSKIPKLRKPYAGVRTKVGDAIRAVLPKRSKPKVSSKAVKIMKLPEKKIVIHSSNPNPAGKTLAQLVNEFQKSPRQYSLKKLNMKDNREAWKSYF